MTLQPPDEAAAIAAAVGPEPLPLVYLGHDLRAALAEMRSGLQLIRALDLPGAAQTTLGRCVAASEMLSRLIDQSVLVCLGQAAPGLMAPSHISTSAWVEDLRLRAEGLARQSGHHLTLEAKPDLPDQFWMDRTALDRILSNLVVNALRHTPPCALRVSLRLADSAKGVVLHVSDSGPGFTQAQLAALAKGTPQPRDDGRTDQGFGLQSVLYLAAAMGGRCNFANRAEGGAEITVTLPFAPDCIENAKTPPLPAQGRLQGASVLLVEDNETCRTAIKVLFGKLGMAVTDVETGRLAIDALASGHLVDFLVLDEQMPDLTGLDVLNWVQGNMRHSARPATLVATSHISADRIRALSDAGADKVITKPVLDLNTLGLALHQILEDREQRRAQEGGGDGLSPLYRLAEIAGPEAARELFERLGEDLQTARSGLALAAKSNDLDGIRLHSHVLIALAGTAGAMSLHEDAVRLNGLAHDGGPAERILAFARKIDPSIAELTMAVSSLLQPRTTRHSLS